MKAEDQMRAAAALSKLLEPTIDWVARGNKKKMNAHERYAATPRFANRGKPAGRMMTAQ